MARLRLSSRHNGHRESGLNGYQKEGSEMRETAVLDQDVTAEDWASKVWSEMANEYDQAKQALTRKLETGLGHITVAELLQSVAKENPGISTRYIRSALADLRGISFYLESDGRIVAPRQARPVSE